MLGYCITNKSKMQAFFFNISKNFSGIHQIKHTALRKTHDCIFFGNVRTRPAIIVDAAPRLNTDVRRAGLCPDAEIRHVAENEAHFMRVRIISQRHGS